MTYELLILPTLLNFAFATVRAADVCTPRPIAASELMGRGFEITLPDGRWLAIVGHEHGPREEQGKLLDHLLDPNLKPAALARANKGPRAKLSIAQTHFNDDLKYLKNLVATKSGPLTIWAEGEAGSTDGRVGDIRAAARLRKIHGTRVDDDLLLASGSPAVYLAAMTTPPRNVRVAGLETNIELTREETARANEIRAGAWSLNRIGDENPAASRLSWATYRRLDKMVAEGRVEEIRKFDVSGVNAEVDAMKLTPGASDGVKRRIAAYLLDRQSAVRRDMANVDAMLAAGTSGVFVVGQNHRGSSVALLFERCKKMESGGTPKASTPAASPDPNTAR